MKTLKVVFENFLKESEYKDYAYLSGFGLSNKLLNFSFLIEKKDDNYVLEFKFSDFSVIYEIFDVESFKESEVYSVIKSYQLVVTRERYFLEA